MVNMQVLELQFTTPEMLKSNRVRISKSYTETIDNIAEDILTNDKIFRYKKRFVYRTYCLVLEEWLYQIFTHMTFIRKLATESISKENNSPHYLFYENTRGIHFRSLQSLYAQGVTGKYHSGEPSQ